MTNLFKYVARLSAEKQRILYLVAGIRIVFNATTGQEELEIEDVTRLKWLGLL